MGRIIAITSGKGGVGKTMTTINMALAARKAGARVLIVDGDLGLSNVDVVMGIEPRGTLADVLDGSQPIANIISHTTAGIDIISSGSGITQLANMTPLVRSFLVHELSKLPDTYDYVFIDTGAGISESVLSLNSVSDFFVVVTTPEPHALTDAYAVVKLMGEEYDRHECAVIINQAVNDNEGRRVANRLADVSKQFCGSVVHHAGTVVTDQSIVRAVLSRSVASAGALSTLCGQGWSAAWCKISELLNSRCFEKKSDGLAPVWGALARPIEKRQNLDL
jgi:flagellar biosynthesis protein FlhG